MNYITKVCELCKKSFSVSEQYANNRLCLFCFNLRKEGIPIVKDKLNEIAMESIWRGLCHLRQGRGTPIRKMIEDAKLIYTLLFEERK